MQLTILGLDPGTNSFAYSVLRLRGTPTKYAIKCLQQGMIHTTIRSLTSPPALLLERQKFQQTFNGLLARFNPDLLIAERYMLRRGQGGTAIESINMMLGILLTMDLPTKVIPSSQWKNAVTRDGIDLPSLYTELKDRQLSPHQIDATHIAAFGIGAALKIPVPYSRIPTLLVGSPREDLGVPFKKPKKPSRKKAKAKK